MRALVWIALGSLASAPALAGTWTNLWRTPDQQGQGLLAAGQAAEAAQRFTDPRLKAYADLEAGRYADAAKLLAPFKDSTSEYNRGNALARSGQLQAALAAYDAALKQDPNDKDIRHNRDVVAKLLQQHPPQSSHEPSAAGGKQGASGQTPDQKQSANGSRKGKGSRGTGQSGASSSGANQGNGARNGQSGSQRNGRPSCQGGGPRAGQPEGKAQGPNGGHGEGASGVVPGTNPSSSGRSGHQGSGAAEAQPGRAQPVSQPTAGAGPSKQSPGQARRDAAWAAALARHEQEARHQGSGAAGGAVNGSLRQGRAGQGNSVLGGTATPKPKPVSEKTLALDQWLRQIPDNPAGLLRRKFLIQYMMRHPGENPSGGNP